MKKEIENYFSSDGSYEKGVALVMEHSNRLALKKQLNIQPKSDYMLGVIHEELRTIANLSQSEVVRLTAFKASAHTLDSAKGPDEGNAAAEKNSQTKKNKSSKKSVTVPGKQIPKSSKKAKNQPIADSEYGQEPGK